MRVIGWVACKFLASFVMVSIYGDSNMGMAISDGFHVSSYSREKNSFVYSKWREEKTLCMVGPLQDGPHIPDKRLRWELKSSLKDLLLPKMGLFYPSVDY